MTYNYEKIFYDNDDDLDEDEDDDDDDDDDDMISSPQRIAFETYKKSSYLMEKTLITATFTNPLGACFFCCKLLGYVFWPFAFQSA